MFFHGLSSGTKASFTTGLSLTDLFIFFYMGQELSFPLRWKERDFKTSSINAIMKKGNISEVGGTGRLHTLQLRPLPLLPFFQEHFLQPGPGHCELWEEWYSALVRKGADFPGMLCVPDPFTNWWSSAAEHIHAVSHVHFYGLKFFFFFFSPF